MLGNRRNVIFRVSIVINVCVLLYAAMHLSSNSGEWVAVPMPVSGDGGDLPRYLPREDPRNESTPLDPTVRNYDESTSQKTPSTAATTNQTVTVANLEKKDDVNFILNQTDENQLSEETLVRLQQLLKCYDKEYELRYEQRGEFWVLKNFVRAEHGPVACHETVTYTTHAGYEFLDNVQPLVERWQSLISLAIHAPGHDLEDAVNSIRYLRDCLDTDLVRKYVTFHVFFSYKHMPATIPDPNKFLSTKYDCKLDPPYKVNSSSTYTKQKNLLYPVNVARNIARDAALTHFILASDIELYPSPNLIPKFLNMIARNEKPLNTSKNPRVFPITLFEIEAKVAVPSTKTELQAMLANKTAVAFHKYVCPHCHNIPQGPQWMSAKETNQMDVFYVGKRRGKHVHWEPIYIGTHAEPHYDERLSWEGMRDKMVQGYVLCVKDYDFMILNNAFLIHKPGIKRYAKDKKRGAVAARQSNFVKVSIYPDLKKLYGTKAGCDI